MQQTQILIALFFCHFLADHPPLQMDWMLSAKRLGKPILPILFHALVHGVLMSVPMLIYLGWCPLFANLILLQIWSHFLIDLWKGRMNGWFPALQSQANKWHWIIFGFDQFLHALVIIIMAYLATKN